jgi:hypothetical protein
LGERPADKENMPITVVDHDVPNQILAVVTGEVGVADLMEFAVTERAGERRSWALIFDTSRGTVNVSSTDVRSLAAFSSGDLKNSPIGPVVIIASELALYGLSRMYQTYSEMSGRTNVGVVKSKQEAQRWLAEASKRPRSSSQTGAATSSSTRPDFS